MTADTLRREALGSARRVRRRRLPPWRVRLPAALAAIVLLVCGLGAGFAPWTLADAGLKDRILTGIERASGLAVTSAGPLTIRLLPWPSVSIGTIALRGAAGALALEADGLTGQLGLASLWDGRPDLQAVALDSPTIALDLDRLQPTLDALVRQGFASPLLALFHTTGLQLRSGVIRLRSTDRRRDALLTEVTATLVWPADDAEANLSGTATWRGVTGHFAADVVRPGDLRAGGDALASMHVKSPVLAVDAEGTLDGTGDRRAAGKLSASTADLQGLLRVIGAPAREVSGLQVASLTGNATLSGTLLSLDEATLHLDAMAFEGALAVRRLHHRDSLAGTLATDHIDLDPFLSTLPALLDPSGAWNGGLLNTRSIAFDDIDLRVSTTSASVGSFRTEDGSLLLQSGDGRLEASIAEARAYGGLLKGRVVATLDGETTGLRAEATLSRLDLASLLKDVPGNFAGAGSLTGHLSLDSRGTSPATLVRGLRGRGELSVHDGEIGSALLAALVRAAPSASASAVPLAIGITPFDAAAITGAVEAGHATLADSWIAWPAARASLSGTASLADQTLDITASVNGPEASAAAYVLKGPWRDLRLKPTRPPPS